MQRKSFRKRNPANPWRHSSLSRRRYIARAFETLEPRLALTSTVLLSEFMASNQGGLTDEDGDHPDWIELKNTASTAIDIGGWYLTDDSANLTKWQLPSTTIAAGGYQIVFADSKDRAVSGQPLHTNFNLSASGEYLALVMPDGVTIAQAYDPEYPEQLANVSYGINEQSTNTQLLNTGAPGKLFVPSSDIGTSWTQPDFVDNSWTSVTTGIGYDRKTIPSGSSIYAAPTGGWRYTYTGDAAAYSSSNVNATLDGTWTRGNSRDSWTGVAPLPARAASSVPAAL